MSFAVVFILWCIVAVPSGFAIAWVESKVTGAPKRTTSAVLLTVFLGLIGVFIIAGRTILKHVSDSRANQQVQADYARRQMQQNSGPYQGS